VIHHFRAPRRGIDMAMAAGLFALAKTSPDYTPQPEMSAAPAE
jgi:hypothetical protein